MTDKGWVRDKKHHFCISSGLLQSCSTFAIDKKQSISSPSRLALTHCLSAAVFEHKFAPFSNSVQARKSLFAIVRLHSYWASRCRQQRCVARCTQKAATTAAAAVTAGPVHKLVCCLWTRLCLHLDLVLWCSPPFSLRVMIIVKWGGGERGDSEPVPTAFVTYHHQLRLIRLDKSSIRAFL